MPVSSEQVQILECRLREQKQTIENTADSLLQQGREVHASESADLADQAVLSYQREMLFNQNTQGRSHLVLIDRALARIADGTYGDCVSCGHPIGLKRLEAVPWTPRCINCQESIERGEIDGSGRAA